MSKASVSYDFINIFYASTLFFKFYENINISSAQFSYSVVIPWTAAHQASLFITNSQRFYKLLSIVLVMPSNHLILCHPLLLQPSNFPRTGIFQ